jgi:acetyl-CoA acyltransferase
MAKLRIAGIGMTRLGKFPARSVKDMTREAVTLALEDAGAALADVEAAWFANTRQALLEGQNTVRGQCALRAMGFSGIPIANVENACASGSTALLQAAAHVEAGYCDVALVVGAEKMWVPERREAMFQAFIGGTDIHLLDETRARLLALGEGAPPPPGWRDGEGERSFFMDIYAAQARFHMRRYGTTAAQFAAAAAKNHAHSALNPLSQYRNSMTIAEVLADKPVVWPFTRAMCAPISDGAAAAVLVGGRAAARFGARRAVGLRAMALASSADRPADDLDNHIGRRAALAAYARAGIGPDDVDVAEVHDASAFAEILQIENLGFCARGDGGPITERGETRLSGRIPVNPSGGLVSKGHPIGATGLIQLHELVAQLRGEAGPRQVPGARLAVAENGGGFWGVEEAATVVSVLEAPPRG